MTAIETTSTVVILASDEALAGVLAAGVAASPAVGSCRRARFDEDPATLAGEGGGVFVLAAPLRRGFPDAEATARAAAGLRAADRVVLLSSAAINEPNAHHPGLLAEERLREPRNGNALAAAWRELEEGVRAALGGARASLTVLRPTALSVPGGRDYWSRLFAGKLAFTLPGFDPTLQVLSGAELAAAVRGVIEAGDPCRGEVFNVTPAGGMPLAKALAGARTLRLPVPYVLQWPARKLLARLGAAPAAQLDYLRYSWTVSGEKLRRRLGRAADAGGGARAHDDFGLDERYADRLGRTLFRFLHDAWWRIECKGLENVPRQGRAVLIGMHRGHQPWDGVMTFHYLRREIGRSPRFLIHPTLVKFPFLAPYMLRLGGIPASRENAAWVLERDEIVAIFPEGIRGAFKMYREAYELGSFGRSDFARIALLHRAPIIPYVTVGSVEIFPILGRIDWSWWKRYSEWPFLPITPTMSTVPLPSKWHTWFLEPVHPEKLYPPEAADDREVVCEISRNVRARMETALNEMLRRRKSIFFGSIFEDESRPPVEREVA